MERIAYFDARCQLGRHPRMPEGQPETPEQILDEMGHFGIHEALVVDSLAASADPVRGNERLVERLKGHPRLHPAWVGMTPHSREMPPPRELVARMRELGVGALYLFPDQFSFTLHDWAVDDLLAELETARVPVFLCPNDALDLYPPDKTDWDNVVRLCRRFPALPVVVTEARIYGGQRRLYGALAACPNLHVDLSAPWLHRCTEFVCREFGAERLVWGSHLPTRTPGAPLTQLNYADITEEERALIAGGNLRRLLSWNPNIQFVGGEVTFPEPIDALHAAARERLPLRGEAFYDCHGHLGWSSRRHVIHETPDGIVAEMSKFGLRAACVWSFVIGDEGYGNDLVAGMLRRYPDRFVGFTMVNANRGERLMWQEMERGLALGMQGIKLGHIAHGNTHDHPNIEVAVRFAHEHRQFILNHNWGPAEHLRRLCATYPNACFFTGHSSPTYTEVVQEHDNLFLCSCPFLGWGETERYVQLYGADRILFGSDLMDLPVGWGVGQILYARIPLADKRKILGGNLLGLMQRYGIHPRGPAG